MNGRLPLSTLLSQALVAFTIEFDNEAEHRIPHTTTITGRTPDALYAPWLVSMVMWFNCMRFVSDEGVSVCELNRLARTGTNLNGMARWGYVTVAPDSADRRPKPPQSAWLIRPRAGGRMAQQIWRTLFPVIEKRWEERFGEPEIRELRESLRAIVSRLDPELPDCLPILGYGLFSSGPCAKGQLSGTSLAIDQDAKADTRSDVDSDLALPSLLSRALLTFAIEFERESDVSLAISATVLRLFVNTGESNGESVRVRDLPRLAGVSKEGIAMAVGYLAKRGYARIERESGKVKVLALTAKGLRARDAYFRLAPEIEKRWRSRFGEKQVRRLRESLEPLVGDGTAQASPLFGGLEPYPEGWRGAVRRPETLPHYPMVLHRGGYPDGS
jgi:DNA-binding MarR family transcriptional regulator